MKWIGWFPYEILLLFVFAVVMFLLFLFFWREWGWSDTFCSGICFGRVGVGGVWPWMFWCSKIWNSRTDFQGHLRPRYDWTPKICRTKTPFGMTGCLGVKVKWLVTILEAPGWASRKPIRNQHVFQRSVILAKKLAKKCCPPAVDPFPPTLPVRGEKWRS